MSSLPKLLITGGPGKIAQALLRNARRKNFDVMAPSRADLDITDSGQLFAAVKHYRPDVIINTAAYTAVDKAETEKDRALSINHQGAKNLACAANLGNSRLIHLSTDYVFNGKDRKAYIESDPTDPINHYGLSKCLGEEAVRQTAQNYVILRVSAVFSPYQHNFVKSILGLARGRETLTVVADQFTCPTAASAIADAIYQLALLPPSQKTYHFCNEGSISWHEFAMKIVEMAKNHISLQVNQINPVASCDFPAAAQRPIYSCLNSKLIEKDCGVNLSHWESHLEVTLSELIKDIM